jgi:phage terminase small subunit
MSPRVLRALSLPWWAKLRKGLPLLTQHILRKKLVRLKMNKDAETKSIIKKPLDAREQIFVGEYLIDLNPERAAIAAGYSKTVARTKAYSWVGNNRLKPHVYQAVRDAEAARLEKLGIKADDVIAEFKLLGLSNMGDFAKWGPEGVMLKDSSQLTKEQTACVAEVGETKTKDGGSIKFKLHDKKGALDSLARHLGLYNADTSNKSDNKFVIVVTPGQSLEETILEVGCVEIKSE